MSLWSLKVVFGFFILLRGFLIKLLINHDLRLVLFVRGQVLGYGLATFRHIGNEASYLVHVVFLPFAIVGAFAQLNVNQSEGLCDHRVFKPQLNFFVVRVDEKSVCVIELKSIFFKHLTVPDRVQIAVTVVGLIEDILQVFVILHQGAVRLVEKAEFFIQTQGLKFSLE